MTNYKLYSRKIELLIYGCIWLLLFVIPLLNGRQDDLGSWERTVRHWHHLTAYMVIFFVNIYLLAPNFLFKKRYGLYFFLAAVTIALVIGTEMILLPRMFGSPAMIMPPDDIIGRQPLPDGKPPLPQLFDSIIIAVLTVAAGAAWQLLSKWLGEERLRKELEKEQLKTNLALLRHQVSPHFFMNTLNNIHALIDINSELAKDAIVRLSTLMRYLLYDSAQGQITLAKEIEFVKSYISLMKLRYPESVNIQVILPENIPEIRVPPMLFISLLENAFKYGISYQEHSYIRIELTALPSALAWSIKNSKHAVATRQPLQPNDHSGIGLNNLKKSLDLLYGTNYQLSITETDNEFTVLLTIPL
jgi:hypothetical protein